MFLSPPNFQSTRGKGVRGRVKTANTFSHFVTLTSRGPACLDKNLDWISTQPEAETQEEG